MELPTSPSDMVTDEFTQANLQVLKEQNDLGEDNPPLYISNVGYGRVLIYKMTSNHTKERIQAAINASYTGVAGGSSGYSEVDLQQTLSTAKIEIATFDGDDSNIEALIRTGRLSEYFTGDTELSSTKPISSEVRRLMDNQKADIVRTTEYEVKTCNYIGKTIPSIGERIRVYFDKVSIPSDCDCDGDVNKGDIYGRFDAIYTNVYTGGDETRRAVTIGQTKVQSGNTLTITNNPNYADFDKYYGRTFRISGQLKDANRGARGTDDIVGNWNANQFDISRLAPGTKTKRAVSNCNGNNPLLTYRLERLNYIYQ